MTLRYTAEGLVRALGELRAIFDLVRIVEPIRAELIPLAGDPANPAAATRGNCFDVWTGKQERCANCISLRAIHQGERQTKYEFVNDEFFYIVAVPIEVDGQSLALEMISRVNDRVLLSAYGANEFVNRITAFNAQLHLDDGTGLFNRSYFEEKLYLLLNKAALNKTDGAVAFLEVDGFDHVSKHFGHHVADEAILAIGRLLTANVSRRRGDFVARYSPNTFAIVLDNIPRLLLRERMMDLVHRVTTLRLMGYEDVHLNVAMGVGVLSEDRAAGVEEIVRMVAHRVDIARAAGFNRIAFADR